MELTSNIGLNWLLLVTVYAFTLNSLVGYVSLKALSAMRIFIRDSEGFVYKYNRYEHTLGTGLVVHFVLIVFSYLIFFASY